MQFHHSYKLSSENRKVPMMMFAKGLYFPWEQLRHDIATDTFDPKNHDMLHALNWMSRHLRDFVQPSADHPEHDERLAAFDAWCSLYPWAPLEVQAHMIFMLQDAPKAHVDLMAQEPARWITALEKSWIRRDDLALWKAISNAIPEQTKTASVTSARLDHALLLLRPHVHSWIKDPTLKGPVSDLIYDTLALRSESPLQEKLATFRLLYPGLDDLPKATTLMNGWDTNNTRDSGERMKLEHFQQLAANLLQLDAQHQIALTAQAVDLPPDAFELQP